MRRSIPPLAVLVLWCNHVQASFERFVFCVIRKRGVKCLPKGGKLESQNPHAARLLLTHCLRADSALCGRSDRCNLERESRDGASEISRVIERQRIEADLDVRMDFGCHLV